jgi:hypothetical protein
MENARTDEHWMIAFLSGRQKISVGGECEINEAIWNVATAILVQRSDQLSRIVQLAVAQH